MQFNLTLSPAQREFLIKPGASFTQAYQVTNNSNSTLILKASLEAWQPQGLDGSLHHDPLFNNPDLSFSLQNSDLSLNQSFKLEPGKSQQLVLKVKSSPTATERDSYYTLFLSQDLNSQIPNDTNSQSFAKVGSNLLLTISNTDKLSQKATFSNLSSSPKVKDSFFNSVTLTGQIDNLSNHFIQPSGTITIQKSGKTLKELKIFPQNVLSNYSRNILCQDNNNPPNAVPCTLQKPLWPGAYQANFTLDSTSSAQTQSLTFFVFPYYLTLGILLLTTIIFAYLKIKEKSKGT